MIQTRRTPFFFMCPSCVLHVSFMWSKNNLSGKMITQRTINELTYQIVGCAIEVNRLIGPGLLESFYEQALLHELNQKGLRTSAQQKVLVPYKSTVLDCDLRLDVLVEDLVVVENKSVSELKPIHEAQLMTYMSILRKPKGILFNFNVRHLFKEGMIQFVNEYYSALPKY